MVDLIPILWTEINTIPYHTIPYTHELEQFRIQSHGEISMAKRDFFMVFWKAWESTFKPPLVLKAFEATGLQPPNPDVILERFESDDSGSDSDDSDNPLTTWQQLNRRFKEVVKDMKDERTQDLNLAFHHLYCFAEINQHTTNELEQALRIKTRRKKPGQALRDPDSDRESGGAKSWSPRSLERQHRRIEAEEEEARLEKLHKAQKAVERKHHQKQKAKELQEKRALREVQARLRLEAAHQKRLEIDARKAARWLKKQHQTKHIPKLKSTSKRKPKRKPVVGRNSGGNDSGDSSARPPPLPPPPPPTTRSGRDIKTPARYQ